MVGFTANHGAQCDQGVELLGFCHFLQNQWDFQGARHGHVQDIFIGHAQLAQLFQACRQQATTDDFIESCLDDTDAQTFAGKIGFIGSYGHHKPLYK